MYLCWFVLVFTCFMVLEWNFDLALVILILLKLFFDLLSCYIISSFSLVLVFWFCEFLSSFVFSLFRFNFNLVFAVPVPFLDLGFLFLLFDYLVLIIYCFYLCSRFFCLVSFVLSWIESCLLSCFALSCPLPRFPGLWPLLPGSSSPLSQVKFLVLWVPTWQLDFCDFWDPLHGPCCPAYLFLWSCRLRAPVRYHLGQAQWSSLLPILCCLPCPSVWTDSLSTLPAVSSQCPVNKLRLSAHLHLGPISCRSLTIFISKSLENGYNVLLIYLYKLKN